MTKDFEFFRRLRNAGDGVERLTQYVATERFDALGDENVEKSAYVCLVLETVDGRIIAVCLYRFEFDRGGKREGLRTDDGYVPAAVTPLADLLLGLRVVNRKDGRLD